MLDRARRRDGEHDVATGIEASPAGNRHATDRDRQPPPGPSGGTATVPLILSTSGVTAMSSGGSGKSRCAAWRSEAVRGDGCVVTRVEFKMDVRVLAVCVAGVANEAKKRTRGYALAVLQTGRVCNAPHAGAAVVVAFAGVRC